jgi:hypothetical protein
MPYAVRKMPNRNCYKVFNKNTKKIYSKCASRVNAQKQLSLLRGIKYNPIFRSKLKRSTMKKTGGKTCKNRRKI